MFRKAQQNRVFQDVVRQIEEAIIDNRLINGDALPPERKLQEMFGVSRGTLREALRVLEQKGLIEIRLGSSGGPKIKEISYDQVSESLAQLIRYQKVSLRHLAEFREDMEGTIAALAVERAGEADIVHLEALLDQAKAFAEKGADHAGDFIEIDKKLHLTLAEMTRNPVYISIQHSVHSNIDRYYERFLDMDKAELRENYLDLKEIVSAIKQGEPDRARHVAGGHVRKFNHYMESNWENVT